METLPHSPHLRSFGRMKTRRLRTSKQQLMEIMLPALALSLDEVSRWRGDAVAKENDVDAFVSGLFPQHSTTSPLRHLSLEIGYGHGEHLAMQVQRNPHDGFIGCEPFVNGIADALAKMIDEKTQAAPNNIRLYQGDVRDVLPLLPNACLDNVYILFPDPWPKTRHHKRRLIQPALLDMLTRVMKKKCAAPACYR